MSFVEGAGSFYFGFYFVFLRYCLNSVESEGERWPGLIKRGKAGEGDAERYL